MLLLIPVGVLLVVSLLFNVATSVTKKFYNKTAPAGRESNWFYNTCMGIACLVFILIFSINPAVPDPFASITDISLVSVGLGLVFGILVLAQSYTYMWALEIGPFSYTSVIVSLASVISADDDLCGLNMLNNARVLCKNNDAGVTSYLIFHTGTDNG